MASEYYLHLIHRKKRSRTLQDKKIEKSSKKGNTPLTKNTKENQSPKESNKKTSVTQEQQLGSEFDNDEKSNSRRNDDNNEDGKLLSSTASQLKKTLNDGDKDHHGKPKGHFWRRSAGNIPIASTSFGLHDREAERKM